MWRTRAEDQQQCILVLLVPPYWSLCSVCGKVVSKKTVDSPDVLMQSRSALGIWHAFRCWKSSPSKGHTCVNCTSWNWCYAHPFLCLTIPSGTISLCLVKWDCICSRDQQHLQLALCDYHDETDAFGRNPFSLSPFSVAILAFEQSIVRFLSLQVFFFFLWFTSYIVSCCFFLPFLGGGNGRGWACSGPSFFLKLQTIVDWW